MSTKALLAGATLCSTLRYFGQAVIGVATDSDRITINEMVSPFRVLN